MKCISCDMEINTKWKHAIDINVCPFCGQGIMEENLKNLFSSLCDTMEQLTEYPDQLNDWLLSNHNYIKTDSEKLSSFLPKDFFDKIEEAALEKAQVLEKSKKHTDDVDDFEKRKNKKFTVKVATDSGGEEDIVAEKIQSEEKTNEFYKRAEAIKPNIEGFKSISEKTQHLKAMAQQIKREGATVMNQSGMAGVISPEMMEMADPEAVAEMQAMMAGGDIVNSALPESEYGSDDDIPSIVLNMANKAQGSGKSSQADLAKLQQLQNRVSGSRKNFLSGGGGFSRA